MPQSPFAMSILTAACTFALYAAAVVLVAGLARKIVQYARTPAPLKIPTTPAPVTRTGVVGRLVREVVLFESLFKASKWTWLFGWVFHAALLVVLVGHLRYFTEPVWAPVAAGPGNRSVRGACDGCGARRAVGSPVPRRPGALHLRSVGPPDARAPRRHRRNGRGDALRRPHRHRRPRRRSLWGSCVSTGSRFRPMECCCCTS